MDKPEVYHDWLIWYKGLPLDEMLDEYVRLDGKEAVKFIRTCGHDAVMVYDYASCTNVFQELKLAVKDFFDWLTGPSELAKRKLQMEEIQKQLVHIQKLRTNREGIFKSLPLDTTPF